MKLHLLALTAILPLTACGQKTEESMPENRLAKEKSPYLRQHAKNPVDWYPWGEEAFAAAREQNPKDSFEWSAAEPRSYRLLDRPEPESLWQPVRGMRFRFSPDLTGFP